MRQPGLPLNRPYQLVDLVATGCQPILSLRRVCELGGTDRDD